MENIKKDLIQSLTGILQIEAVSSLKIFIEGEVSLLFLLFQRNCPMPPSEIAKDLNISKGRVTALLNSLSEKKMIDISISMEDRRKFDVSLTSQGLLFLKEKQKEAEAYFDIMIARIGEDKSRQLIGLIQDIVHVMKE